MTTPNPAPRLASLDQFRGYTVVGMLFVNFAGGYREIPTTFGHHHTYCSFADTIMPQFLFAVGYAMRLTFLKRVAIDGAAAAYRKAIIRSVALFLLACVVYHLTGGFKTWKEVQDQNWATFFEELFKRGPFETLAHIAVTSLVVLPVIAQPHWVRMLAAVAFGSFHVWLSHVWYYQWNLAAPVGIDGGPLGFLSWSIPLIVGTLAFDLQSKSRLWIPVWGAVLCLAAMGMMYVGNPKAAFPFSGPEPKESLVLNIYTMSQRAGSVTYTLFGAGVALLIYSLFQHACDGRKWNVPVFDLFGRHALASYLIHDLVSDMVKPFVPKDAPLWYVLAGFGLYFGVTWLFVRYLDRHKLFLRL